MEIKLCIEIDDELYKDFTEDDEEGVIARLTEHWNYQKDGVLDMYITDMSPFEPYNSDEWNDFETEDQYGRY